MARFRATIEGERGLASRLGSARSGIHAEVHGWEVGVRTAARVDPAGQDTIDVFATLGSNARDQKGEVYLGRVKREGERLTWEPSFDSLAMLPVQGKGGTYDTA